MAINYGRKYFERVLIFRPHNVYGPDMGFEHVIPQFAVRLKQRLRGASGRRAAVRDPGQRRRQTRSFCHVDDLVAGVMVMREKGEHLGIYHVGTTEEIAIADLARRMAAHRRPRDRARPSAALGRQHDRAAARIFRNLRRSAIDPRVPLDAGPAADARLVLGSTSTWRRRS